MSDELGNEVGEILHYYGHIQVAVVRLSDALKTGEKIRVKGHTTNFEQEVGSMQVDHNQIEAAEKGQEIGMKVNDKVREQDKVYKV